MIQNSSAVDGLVIAGKSNPTYAATLGGQKSSMAIVYLMNNNNNNNNSLMSPFHRSTDPSITTSLSQKHEHERGRNVEAIEENSAMHTQWQTK